MGIRVAIEDQEPPLPELVEAVHAGEEVIFFEDGLPVAKLEIIPHTEAPLDES
jgi:antitoxin (DNA-binding transcriptional repressor) of toxin-antitoxin stability system